MNPLEIIRNSKNFRTAVWSKDFDLKNPEFLFEICCASLFFDYNHSDSRKFRENDKVELSISFNDVLKRFYLKYIGLDQYNGISRVILCNDDDKCITTYRLNASNYFWRLNKCKNKNQTLTTTSQLKKYQITNPPSGSENPIKILSSKINIPYDRYNFFNRTYLLLLLKQPLDEIIFNLKNWEFHGQTFLEYFPAYHYFDADNFKKINSEKFDRSEPERILHLFTDQADLLDFINNNGQQNSFLIISDNYNRFFNPVILQYLFQTLNRQELNIKLLYFGDINDFRKLNNELSLTFNQFIKPTISNGNSFLLKDIKKKIEIVGDKSINDLINDSLLIAKQYKDINPSFSTDLRKILYNLSSLDKFTSELFKKTYSIFIKEYRDNKVVDNLKELFQKVKENQYKFIQTNTDEFLVTDIPAAEEIKDIIGKKEIKTDLLNGSDNKNYIITFLDTFFFHNILFPAILLNYISIDKISFRLYSVENKILLHSFHTFKDKYYKFFEIDSGPESKNESVEEIQEEHIKLFELDVSSFFNKQYIGGNTANLVNTVTVMSEDENSEYISFFPTNYTLTILDNDSVYDINPDELEVGHEIIIIPGVRNVFQKFSEIFENKEIQIEIRNKWKEALYNFSNKHSFRILLNQLRQFGIKRNEATIKNWINNKSVIGTLYPKEDFLKIAKATNDRFLLDHYNEIAEVCITLQRMSKIIGRRIKKFSMAVLKDHNLNDLLTDYDPNVREKIKEVVQNVKVVTVTNIYHDLKPVEHSLINQLIDKEKLWV